MQTHSGVPAQMPDLAGLGDTTLLELAEAVFDRLRANPLSGAVDDIALGNRVRRLDRLRSMLEAEQARCVGEVAARRSHAGNGGRTPADDLAANLRLSKAEARRRVKRAKTLERLPKLAERLANGEANTGHVDAAARGLDEVDRQTAAEEQAGGGDLDAWKAAKGAGQAAIDELDELVADQAPATDGTNLRRRVDAWAANRTADALAARQARARRRRGVWFDDEPDSDGLCTGRFALQPDVAARWRAQLDTAARKRDRDDERTMAQRRHDALATTAPAPAPDRAGTGDAADDGAADDAGGDEASAAMHTSRSRRARALLITTPEALRDLPGAQPSMLDGHGPVSSATARMLLCGDAEITVVAMLGDTVLDIGRIRDATPEIWAAVVARDRVCQGCGAPATDCELHHVVYWDNGGHTKVTNLTLLCWSCHTHVHHHGWRVDPRPGGGFTVTRPYRHPVLEPAGAGDRHPN